MSTSFLLIKLIFLIFQSSAFSLFHWVHETFEILLTKRFKLLLSERVIHNTWKQCVHKQISLKSSIVSENSLPRGNKIRMRRHKFRLQFMMGKRSEAFTGKSTPDREQQGVNSGRRELWRGHMGVQTWEVGFSSGDNLKYFNTCMVTNSSLMGRKTSSPERDGVKKARAGRGEAEAEGLLVPPCPAACCLIPPTSVRRQRRTHGVHLQMG